MTAISVIVRTQDSAATLEACLASIRRQTIPAEIVVVDAGSRDGTLTLAERLADRIERLAPGTYTPGLALNTGAAAAAAPAHAAVSSHCVLPREDWLAVAAELVGRERVAAANGNTVRPDGRPLAGTYLQSRADMRANPFYGLSNHASAWRAEVWRARAFDETLPTVEDKHWAQWVLDQGWAIAFDPRLAVAMTHRWRRGAATYYRREREEIRVLGSFEQLPPYGLREAIADWWRPPDDRHPALVHRLNPRRAAGIAGHYAGRRQTAR